MSVSITLTKALHHTGHGTYCLRFTAVAFGCSSKVFAIEVLPKTADPRNPHVRFSHVCSPAELVEFPADEPAYGSCYFRTDSVEFIFDTVYPVEHVTSNMRHDVKHLEDELNELDALGCGCTSEEQEDSGNKKCCGFRINSQGPLSLRPETADEGYVFYDNVGGDLYIWQEGAWSEPVHFRGPAGASLPDGPVGHFLQKTETGVQWVKVEAGLSPEALSGYYTAEQVNDLLADKQNLLDSGNAGQVLSIADDGKTLVWKNPGTEDISDQILVVSDVLPSGGTAGQVLTVGDDGETIEWQTPQAGGTSDQVLVVSDTLPDGGTDGQVLSMSGSDNYAWVDVVQLIGGLVSRIEALEDKLRQ